MESTSEFWSFRDRLPPLLQQYSTHSYVLLLLLGVAGTLLLGWHFFKKQTSGKGLPVLIAAAGSMLLFLSIGGAILKFSYGVSEQQDSDASIAQFIEDHRVDKNEHWVIVIDFIGSMTNTTLGNSSRPVNSLPRCARKFSASAMTRFLNVRFTAARSTT